MNTFEGMLAALRGIWRVQESTLAEHPSGFMVADVLVQTGHARWVEFPTPEGDRELAPFPPGTPEHRKLRSLYKACCGHTDQRRAASKARRMGWEYKAEWWENQ